MKKLIVLLCLTTQLSAQKAEWTVLNCVGACNNLSSYGIANVELMKSANISTKTNWLIQLDDATNKQTLRYKIASQGITDNISIKQPLGINQKEELITALHWAATYPARYFFLLFWDHGNGILDQSKRWEDYELRGLLYNFNQKTYLQNQELKTALIQASTKILGKKIDIIGMDACLMAMLEVAYQIKDAAQYFIASQNIEKTPGWNYQKIIQTMNASDQTLDPLSFARIVVSTFMELNEWRNNISTLSVIDLTTIEDTKIAVDKMANELLVLLEKQPKQFHEIIRTARTASINFDDKEYPYLGYIDLGSFIKNMIKLIDVLPMKSNNLKSKRSDNSYEKLKNTLLETLATIKKSVVHMYAGAQFKETCGLSIYFPEDKIQPSYLPTDFAQASSWTTYLQRYLQLRTYKFKWPVPLPRKGL